MPRPTVSARYPCIFKTQFLREQIDPRVDAEWRAMYGQKPRFGDLRQIWRRQHCAVLNPYDSTHCPYSPNDCAMQFFAAVQSVTLFRRISPVGYFRSVAKTFAVNRADNKPLARDAGVAPVRPDARQDVPRARTGLVPIGDLLRSFDPGSRKGSAHDGQESTQ